MAGRAKHFRGVMVKLECGCWVVEGTSFYRISKSIRATLVNYCNRRGVWCLKHGGKCQPVRYGKTVISAIVPPPGERKGAGCAD